MRRHLLVASLGALVLMASLLAVSAFASGGANSIASAPQLPTGQNVVGGGTCSYTTGSPTTCNKGTNIPHGTAAVAYFEYWRINALASDHLTIDYGSNDGNNVELCVLDPGVTDYTVSNAGCLADDATTGKHELTFTFPSAGTWTLFVGGGRTSMAYEMTAYIRHYTHTMITAPPVAKSHSAVRYVGIVSGASDGKVELQSRSLGHPGWKTFALASISANGRFSYKTRVAKPGTYRIKAVYPGDSSHLPSSAMVSFKVF